MIWNFIFGSNVGLEVVSNGGYEICGSDVYVFFCIRYMK